MIGLTRIYCHQGEVFMLVDIPTADAEQMVLKLEQQGWDIEAQIPV